MRLRAPSLPIIGVLAVACSCVVFASWYTSSSFLLETQKEHVHSVSFHSPAVDKSGVRKPRILYITRHEGTMIDFKHVAEGLNMDLAMVHPGVYTNYGISNDSAQSVVKSGLVDALCEPYDAVFVGDTISDGWPFYKPSVVCKRVILLVTNRFDVLTRDDERPKLVAELTDGLTTRPDSFFIVANNPFEEKHMKAAGVDTNRSFPVIRPLGYTRVPAQEIGEDPPACVIIRSSRFEENLLPALVKNADIDCRLLPRMYGGPLTLAKYNAVVHIPYQVSVMKNWENLAAKVVTVVPTPRFFKQLIEESGDVRGDFGFIEIAMQLIGEEWSNYVEFYDPQWSSCFPQFSSFEHLALLLQSPTLHANVESCYQMVLTHRQETLAAWRRFFEQDLKIVLL